jgi:hypothetical protein
MADAKDGPFELLLGGLVGLVGFGAIAVPKAVVDVIGWLAGLFGADTKPLRLAKGGVDLGLGGLTAWDAWAHPKDDFWKGAEWTFAVLELLAGGVTTASAVADYVSGSLGEGSLDFQADKRVVELLTGRKYER